MPRPIGSFKTPSLCHHKRTGQAYVTIAGKQTYLGLYGSKESRAAYDRVVGRFLAAGRTQAAPAGSTTPNADTTIAMLLAAFWTGTESSYKSTVTAPGKRPTGERGNFWDAMRVLRRIYGDTLANEFDALCLEAMRDEMIRLDWCRNHINRQVHRIRAIFQWGVSKKIVRADVWQSLLSLRALRANRSAARETQPVRPVSQDVLNATLPYLGKYVRAMVELLLHTGMRTGELVIMRTADIDTRGPVWIYRPTAHKTQHHGIDREIRMGPRAIRILTPFLKTDLNAFVFSPQEAEEWRHAQQRQARKTKVQPSQVKRAAASAKRKRRRPLADRYDVASFRRAIYRACDRADAKAKIGAIIGNDERLIPQWHPHQLRHNFATMIRSKFGADAALVLLGDRTTRMVDVYAEKDAARAEHVIARVG